MEKTSRSVETDPYADPKEVTKPGDYFPLIVFVIFIVFATGCILYEEFTGTMRARHHASAMKATQAEMAEWPVRGVSCILPEGGWTQKPDTMNRTDDWQLFRQAAQVGPKRKVLPLDEVCQLDWQKP